MRHLLTALSGLVLLVAVIGCNHTCGVCDCVTYAPCAGGGCAVTTPIPAGAHVVPVETLNVMPKGEAKE
jgi:hypothetical protein